MMLSEIWKRKWEIRNCNNYHPMRSFLKASNFCLPKGLVKMSAQLWWVSIFIILMWPTHIWSRKWCHFIAMCFLHCLQESLLARTMHTALSSYIYVAERVSIMVVLYPGASGILIILYIWTSSIMHRRGSSKSLVAMDKARYSLLVVTYPVQDHIKQNVPGGNILQSQRQHTCPTGSS